MWREVGFSEIDKMKFHRFAPLFLSAHDVGDGDMEQDHSSIATILVDDGLNPGVGVLADGWFIADTGTCLFRRLTIEVRNGEMVEFSEGEETAFPTKLTIADLNSLNGKGGVPARAKSRAVENAWEDISERRIPGR